MDIKILGTGCGRCEKLEKEVINALAEMDVAADVKKVKDIREIMSYKIMSTPALVVNGKVKVAGKVPKRQEIKKYIQEELA
ncbi:MAG: thioredoxin family protein [Syntrophomonadaceae bacterium]|nr:thioredoxin family protein [Syntrophomonadaceae bacterium]